MEKRRRSPQDKKIRSYQHDGRNAYGESTGGSRRGIRQRKRLVNKANRRAITQALGEGDADAVDAAAGTAPKRWRKIGDIPLASWLVRQRRRHRLDAPPIDSALLREARRREERSKRGRS